MEIRGDSINLKKKNLQKNVFCSEKLRKGDGTMSAATQNFVYSYGKKQDGKRENTISSEKLKEIKESLGKFLSDRK